VFISSRYEDFVLATKCRRNRRDRKCPLQYVTRLAPVKFKKNLNFSKQVSHRFGILPTHMIGLFGDCEVAI